MAERVLFTCVGTSDPVREMRDGSMLHIMRHYRPEKVYIFLSKEMEDFEKADRRLEKRFVLSTRSGRLVRRKRYMNTADFSMLRIWMRLPIRCLLSLKK